jgi:hypothetical protein
VSQHRADCYASKTVGLHPPGPCKLTPRQILDLPLEYDDTYGTTTVRGFLVAMLHSAFECGEVGGDSNWRRTLYFPLARAGCITGTFNDDDENKDYVENLDVEAGNRLIKLAIDALGEPAQPAQQGDPDAH